MQTVTIQQINATIISGEFSNDQLDSIIMAVKFARGQLAKKNKASLVRGTKVKFVSSRSGKHILGTVEKVNRKFVIVYEQGGAAMKWRVPANMLEVAE
jgi:ribosomal protein L35AE/L33A